MSQSAVREYGRKRSSTHSSIHGALSQVRAYIPPPPLSIGDSCLLTAWIHPEDDRTVRINPDAWPGIAEGDLVEVTNASNDSPSSGDFQGFVFSVSSLEDTRRSSRLQISIPKKLAERFKLEQFDEVLCTKVNREKYQADYVELTFKDQYLGRSDMWRFVKQLSGQCLHQNEEVTVSGLASATATAIYTNNRKTPSSQVGLKTKAIFRSLSAKVTIFIQVCKELWDFATDGERYYEKVIHSFLPALFSRWRGAGTNHTVTIVLISRVFYDECEIDYAAGPVRKEEELDSRWFKDFYRVITDLEVVHDWKPTLGSLKNAFLDFHRDILLTHNYHRRSGSRDHVRSDEDAARVVGQLSYAHEGPILEAINMSLNPSECHYIDRSLSMTGLSNILITPGTGHFRVARTLLQLTTTRILDQGFGLDLVSLAKPPLHTTPIFSFVQDDKDNDQFREGYGSLFRGNLWNSQELDESFNSFYSPRPKDELGDNPVLWWEPFWVTITFWDLQLDLPFRDDRFVAVCGMKGIHGYKSSKRNNISSATIPWLSIPSNELFSNNEPHSTIRFADQFDSDVFSLSAECTTGLTIITNDMQREFVSGSPSLKQRFSIPSGVSSMSSNWRASSVASDRSSWMPSKPSISSMRSWQKDLISKNAPARAVTSKEEVQSNLQLSKGFSHDSGATSTVANKLAAVDEVPPLTFAQKITSASWLTNPFRHLTSSSTAVPQTPSTNSSAHRQSAIRERRSSHGSRRVGTLPENGVHPFTPRLVHVSPLSGGSPPRKETIINIVQHSSRATYPRTPFDLTKELVVTNPSLLQRKVTHRHISLSKRWKHVFPQPSFKHEIKWKSLVTPSCLPLTTDYFPSQHELDTEYDVFTYDFVLDHTHVQSYLLRNPLSQHTSPSEVRDAWALAILRGMTASRLAQGFQFVLQSGEQSPRTPKRSMAFVSMEDEYFPKPLGATQVLQDTAEPVYLSMSNEIHRLSYIGDSIHVTRHVRRMPKMEPFHYQCLVWPKQGDGYKVTKVKFPAKSFLEDYGWNRLDMLIAGYERSFSESIKYWRTRFLVLPSSDPQEAFAPTGERLTEEELRLQGIDKLAEIFGKHRWADPSDAENTYPAPRFLPTWLEPSSCVLDEALISQLELIHEQGPLKKKARSDKSFSSLGHGAICKAIREANPSVLREHRWYSTTTFMAFTGYELVSWLVREFTDVSTRDEAVQCGQRLIDEGVIEHFWRKHGFLDGHYFYHIVGENAVPSTPRTRWWRNTTGEEKERTDSRTSRSPEGNSRKKRLILSQQMILDVDPPPNRKSDQAEVALLHHDIIHNAETCFHFELHWVAISAHCIEDMLKSWQSRIDKYGLKLVEAYVDEISLVSSRNPFQSYYPITLAVPPPESQSISNKPHYFECMILTRRFGFVLDIEAASRYPSHVDVYYSYRRSPFQYSQYVHRSGIAFVQVMGGSEGYRFLTNRLHRQGYRDTSAARQLREQLQEFCSDPIGLSSFYKSTFQEIGSIDVLPEPPPLTI